MTYKKMNRLSALTFIRSIIILACLSLPVLLKAQTDEAEIIYPTATITPFELPADEPINFPLYQATPVGDINGDGFTDLLYKSGAADERTPNMADWILKSVIITEPGINPEGIVFYDADFYGIGDYNGDGFDDVLDFKNKLIRFGSAVGIANDSLVLSYPDDISEFIMAGDINNDGYSEILLKGTPLVYYMCISGPDTATCYPDYASENHWIYDYDDDGETEVCFFDNGYPYGYAFRWYEFDRGSMEFIHEDTKSPGMLHEPSVHYPMSFCDINGDQLIDLAYVVYAGGDTTYNYNLDVYFGLPEPPYFSDAVEIEMNTKSRMLYDGGDINGDGYDDWYASYWNDTVAVYYGRNDVATNGFQKELVYTGLNGQFLLRCGYMDEISIIARMKDFDYNNDGTNDLFFNWFSYDDQLRFDTVGTAIILGEQILDFDNPIIVGKTGTHKFSDLEFGKSTQNIGDINKDGYDDWGVLASTGCYLEIFYGGPEFNFEPDITFLMPQIARANCFDWSFGDMNGDSWIDIAITNSSNWEFAFRQGIIAEKQNIYIFYGNEEMLPVYYYDDADVILQDDGNFYEFGVDIAIVGDYNADGFDDLVVGNSIRRNGTVETLIFFGSDTSIGPEPDVLIDLPESSTFINLPISACGDVTGDGFDDFSLGFKVGGEGRSLIYYGGPQSDEYYDRVIASPTPNSSSFGYYTPISSGDFDGDGFNDLAQYCNASKEILIYKGGPELNSQADYVISDSLFLASYYKLDFINSQNEIGSSSLSACFKTNGCNDFHIYSMDSYNNIEESHILKNCLGWAGTGIASGDFNNDDLTEIFTGIYSEPNFGIPGGIVYFYEPTLFTDIEEEQGGLSTDEPVRLYPNPTSGVLYLESTRTISQIDIFNHVGQLVFSEKIASSSHAINISRLKPGIYFARITMATGISTQQVIIR